MKKVVFTVALLAGVVSLGHAQVRVGLKGGVNLANLGGDGKDDLEDFFGTDLKSKIGFHAGVVLNAPLTSDGFFSIQPELLYSQKGTRLEEDGDKITIHHNYVELPILAKINADGFTFEAGPQIGVLVNAKTKTEIGGQTQEDSDTDGIAGFQAGYAVGVGYQLPSGPNFGIRYTGNITDAFDDNDDEDARLTHQVFQFSVGYLFGGK